MAAASAGHAIVVGATFPDYKSFEEAFQDYCEKTGYVFSKNGKTIESANRKINNPSLHFKPKLKYQIITFQCKHFGEYTSKGKGIRKGLMSYKIGCKASLKLSADRRKDCLEIRHFEAEHSHPVASGIGHKYPEVRRPTANQREEVDDLLEMQVPATSIQRMINQKHGLTMLSQDIHNLRDKNRKTVQAARSHGEMLSDSLKTILQNLDLQACKGIADQQRVSSMILKTPSVAPGVSALTQSAMQQISEVATNVVTGRLMHQLEKSENPEYSVESGEGDDIVVKCGDKQYTVSDRLMCCTCIYFVKYSLPCSHIFLARREQGQAVFVEEMIPQDAKKSVVIDANRSGENVSTKSHGAFLTPTSNAKSPAVPESHKFRVAMEELKILASSMVKCNRSRFEARVQQVRKLHSLWWSDMDVSIIEVSASSSTAVQVPSASASPSPVEHVPTALVESIPCPSAEPVPSSSNGGDQDVCMPPSIAGPSHSSASTFVSVPSSSDGGTPPARDQDVCPPPSIAGPSHSSPSPTDVVSSSDALSSLKALDIPPPLKFGGRPEGVNLTVVGKRKREGNDQTSKKRKKSKSWLEAFLCRVADKESSSTKP